MKALKYILLYLFLSASSQIKCQTNAELISQLRTLIFTDKDSIEVEVITTPKTFNKFKAPQPNINFKDLESLMISIENRKGDTLFSDLADIIKEHDTKFEREWPPLRNDLYYEENDYFKYMFIRYDVLDLLERTRVMVHLNNKKLSISEKYTFLREYYLSGGRIKNEEWINNSILVSQRYKERCCGWNYSPMSILYKNLNLFEEAMLADFEKIAMGNYKDKDKEEKYYYVAILPRLLENSKGDQFEQICEKAYDAKQINGDFIPEEFSMFMHLGRRGKPRGIALLLKDLFKSDSINFENKGHIFSTELGTKMFHEAVVSEIIKRKDHPSQKDLISYYLKLDSKKAYRQLKKCKKYFNQYSAEIPEIKRMLK
jgi:hypothetical protein